MQFDSLFGEAAAKQAGREDPEGSGADSVPHGYVRPRAKSDGAPPGTRRAVGSHGASGSVRTEKAQTP